MTGAESRAPTEEVVSDQLERWLRSPGPKTLGSLIELFGERSFAIVFVLLMAVPALPLPTGGATHVLEIVTMLLALELVVGRRTIWLPARFRRVEIGSRERFVNALLRQIRFFERFSRPRLRALLRRRLVGALFGAVVFALALAAFFAPPFSGLDTIPSIGVVVLSLGFLLEDFVLAVVGAVIGAGGAIAILTIGHLVVKWVRGLF